jgi:hypothetical protein
VGVAARINILAALCSAVSAGMWFLIAERVVSTWLPLRWQRIACGAAAAFIGATAFTVWTQSVVNEKVYTLSLTGIAIISWLALRWLDDPRGKKADQLLIIIAYLCGLGYANHMAGMLAAPAVVLAVLLRDPRSVLRPRLLATCAAVLLLGLTPFITQPIRAGYNPAINEGGVSACTTSFALSCTLSGTTLDRFLYNFNRGQYSKPSVLERQAPFVAQVDMWWLYFKWQWLRDPFYKHGSAQTILAILFFSLGIAGAWVHRKRDPVSFTYFGPLMLLMTVGLIFYLNFKYGHSQAPELGRTVEREVRDRDYFYLWSFSGWSVWVGTGLAFTWASIAQRLQRRAGTAAAATSVRPSNAHDRSWLLASPVLLLALVPLVTNYSAATRHDDNVTGAWARDLLNSVEPYGVLIVAGDNDTFPLWYAQEVENVRKDVIVANTSLLGTDWHPRQILLRPVHEYNSAAGPAIYRDKDWRKPSGPPLKLSREEADAVPEIMTPVRPMRFEAHGITATINPADLDYGYIKRGDLLVLQMILDASPERPIYFSRSTGDYPAALGLAEHIVGHGLAEKLQLPGAPASAEADTMRIAGYGLVDMQRAMALWNGVYEGHDALARKGRWVDSPSASIPLLYVALGAELVHLLDQRGDSTMADSVFARTLRAARATSVPDIEPQLRATRIRG